MVIVFLYVGGDEVLIVLWIVLIVLGVFYIIMLCFMCVVFWRVVKIEVGDFDVNGF